VHEPLLDLEPASAERVFAALRALLREQTTVLLHRDTIDEAVCGILAGYLVYAGLVTEPIVATDTIQRILRRPLGPEARSVIPETAGA
jgi:ABC-type branched-subunit amino acid transport system ATPase component